MLCSNAYIAFKNHLSWSATSPLKALSNKLSESEQKALYRYAFENIFNGKTSYWNDI